MDTKKFGWAIFQTNFELLEDNTFEHACLHLPKIQKCIYYGQHQISDEENINL